METIIGFILTLVIIIAFGAYAYRNGYKKGYEDCEIDSIKDLNKMKQ